MLRIRVAVAALLLALPPAPLAAQDLPPDSPPVQGPPAQAHKPTAEEVLEAESQSLKAPGTLKPCPRGKGNEIVVCAQDQGDQRVPSDTDQGLNTKDGLPRAPDVFGIPEGGVVVARGCFFPPCPRKMPPIIDLKKIPEAPPGSDAARYKDAADSDARAAAAAN